MRVPFVDLSSQYLSLKEEIDEAISRTISNCAFVRGPEVEKFEESWADVVGVNHCVSCANGTDALYIAMRGLQVKPGDEVITTAHSWISTSETITQAGGKVVFVDTDEDTFTIDPALIEEKITSRTVGIIPVHLFGQSCDMDPILEIAGRHGLWILEDCAQAHLATYKGRQIGTFGNAATYSFYPGKNLGAYGDAGAVVTNDDSLADWCTNFARHGGKGEHIMEGINSRMDGIQAAILNVKLPHLAGWTEGRRRAARAYDEMLSEREEIILPVTASGRDHVYHLYVIRTGSRDKLRQHLKNAGIATGINYSKALPFYPAYEYLGHDPTDFPVAYGHQSQILSLPIYPELTDAHVSQVREEIFKFLDEHEESVPVAKSVTAVA